MKWAKCDNEYRFYFAFGNIITKTLLETHSN